MTELMAERANASGEVFVVEDDPEINELIGAYVEIAGHIPHRFSNGCDALRAAAEHPPAMVVLDVMLPDIDGLEICCRLRAQPCTANVPIVMLTALDPDVIRARATACGASDVMTKPFDPDKLLEVIHTYADVHPAGEP